jgi:threonylcarbamoyladenosine tRNA methylthiotransferase MtaB
LVKTQEGCNNYCSYCIVPYVRGKSRSRKVDEIVAEINQLVKQGIKEVVLTGIDIASYDNLAQLIKSILRNTKIKKISFGSINIEAFDDDFIRLFRSGIANRFRCRSECRLTKHFHIPLQSGSDTVLKRMNRKYTAKQFIKKVHQLKKEIKDFSFSTDIIVGFPGETEKEFQQTIAAIKKFKKILGKSFTHAHVFRFSPREGTAAANMLGQKGPPSSKASARQGWEKVSSKSKKTRSKIIRELLNQSN